MRHRAATLFTAHTGRPKGRWLGRAAYSADLKAGRLGRVGDEIVRHAEIPFPGLKMSRCRPDGFACSRPIQVLSASAGDRICRWTVEVASTPLNGYDYGTRNPEQTYSTPDLCVSADDSRN